MSKSNNLGDFLTGIADAIRAKTGSSALIDPQDFDTEIANLPTGGGKFGELVDRSITEVTAEDLDGVTSIGTSAFWNCSNLLNVTIPNTITELKEHSFRECTSLTSITIPDSVTSIGNYAFYNCSSLTYAKLSENITSIPLYCFSHTSISSINVPTGVTKIGSGAFLNCTSLRTVTMPSSVTNIESMAFKGCASLDVITILATTPPTLNNSNAFDDTNNCPIYVPSGSVSAYQSASQWSSLSSRFQPITYFSSESWNFIRQKVREGTASNYFAVGDTRIVTLTNGTSLIVRIADMTTGRYDFADGSNNKSNMVIEFVQCFANTSYMNSTNTNVGGWADSEMRSTTMTACLALLPQDMQDAISEVTVLSGTGDSSISGTSSSANKLFLPCEWEILGSQRNSIGSSEAGLGGQFEYYSTHNTSTDRIKQREGSNNPWWLRSPQSGNSRGFCSVEIDGSVSIRASIANLGVAPVFAI